MGAREEEGGCARQKVEGSRGERKVEWLNLLFTGQSVAAQSPEGPLPVTFEGGNTQSPSSLIVWVGDSPKSDDKILKDVPSISSSAGFVSVSWSNHPAGEGFVEQPLTTPEVLDG